MKEINQLPYARKKAILEKLKQNDFVKTEQLAKDLNVSYMTVYRDIMELEQSGDVHRVYGGAKAVVPNDERIEEPPVQEDPITSVIRAYGDLTIEERFAKEVIYKQAIAKAAAELVNDGDVIALDPSTTTLHMCSHLMEKNIIVVTTSLSVALQFSASETVTVILCGGLVRRKSLNIIGPYLEDTLQHLRIDKCFISSHAFSSSLELSDLTIEESNAKRQLIKQSNQLYVLVDRTKLNREASFVVCKAKEINCLITDDREITDEIQNLLDECSHSGCKIIFANASAKNQ